MTVPRRYNPNNVQGLGRFRTIPCFHSYIRKARNPLGGSSSASNRGRPKDDTVAHPGCAPASFQCQTTSAWLTSQASEPNGCEEGTPLPKLGVAFAMSGAKHNM